MIFGFVVLAYVINVSERARTLQDLSVFLEPCIFCCLKSEGFERLPLDNDVIIATSPQKVAKGNPLSGKHRLVKSYSMEGQIKIHLFGG